jgi:hypothetical protein
VLAAVNAAGEHEVVQVVPFVGAGLDVAPINADRVRAEKTEPTAAQASATSTRSISGSTCNSAATRSTSVLAASWFGQPSK